MQICDIKDRNLDIKNKNENKNNNNFFISVNTPVLSGNEKKYLNECIDSGWISSDGPFIKEFEEKFAKKVDRKYGIAVCNGSVALDLAVLALDLPRGSEVIMPTFTIISCAAAIVRAGLKIVLIDSDPEIWNMDVNQIEKKITKNTKAIMVVHLYGLPVDMDPILELAKKYDLKIIEDAAEMHGQIYKNKKCGSFGDISTFSFYANKHITTGEGGMIVTDNQELAQKCQSLRNLCFKPERRFVHDELGFNYRITNMQAALGLAQLEKLDETVNKKRWIGKLYTENLQSLSDILQLPLVKTEYAQNIYWVYGLVLKNKIKFDAQEIMQKLQNRGVGTRPFFWCMHEQPVFKKMDLFNDQNYPVAQNMARRGFYLPSGLNLQEEQILKVCEIFKEILGECI
ncbi:MAG: DegT/DnrJ/EryC1/StrS family aminotransferase [Candidatus Babeliales bacterium]